jgi:hypothetical protein
MVAILVVWLHLRAHLSRSSANALLRAMQAILSMTLELVQTALLVSGFNVRLPGINIPCDVRTAFKLCSVEPEIIRTACCPKCFSLIARPIPWRCQWKASPRSRPCNAELWKLRNTQRGPKWVPKKLYTTQSFDSWLKFFLSRQVIEESLEQTFQRHHFSRQSAALGAEMHDVQDSPAWQRLYDSVHSAHHLIFAIYIDWFNPYTNKIAG